MRRRRPSLGRSAARVPKTHRWLRTLLGLLILAMGGAGIWAGALWLEPDSEEPLRTLAHPEAAGPTVSPRPPDSATIPRPGARVRVEILNAGGVRGAAAQARDHLRDFGFDVVYFGNAPTFGESSSRVLLRAGPLSEAEAVAQALGIESVEARLDPSLLVDVTVLVGSEWPAEWARIMEGLAREDRDD